jgi:hypothetical protein
MAGKPRNKLIKIDTNNESISVYASPKIGRALEDIRAKNDLYDGVRLLQILEVVYTQGKKDGARAAFDSVDDAMSKAVADSRKAIPHRNPGKPRKKR